MSDEKNDNPLVERDDKGRFPEGKSGNPTGRPRGSRNQINLLKESLELALREQGYERMQSVLDKAFELALQGDRTMLKLLLELHMSKGASNDGSAGSEKVSINIRGPAENTIREVFDNDTGEPDNYGDEREVSDER